MPLEAEYAMLGCLLQKGELIKETALQPDHFYETANRIIFKTMKEVEKREQPIDLVTVVETIETGI